MIKRSSSKSDSQNFLTLVLAGNTVRMGVTTLCWYITQLSVEPQHLTLAKFLFVFREIGLSLCQVLILRE